jgi:hypothetical protein
MNLGDESGSSSASSRISEYVSSSAAFISCDLVSIRSVGGVRAVSQLYSLRAHVHMDACAVLALEVPRRNFRSLSLVSCENV